MTTAAKTQPVEADKKKRTRSPNYPAVGLKEAIERLKKFVLLDGKAGAKADIAAKHIGFASAHGQAYSVLSALKKFGLIEDKDGRATPTTRGMEIASLPDGDERRKKAIQQAAVAPQIYAELIEQYKDTGLPSMETLGGELIAYKNFNPNGVKEFLKAFTETLEFAGLSDISALASNSEEGKDTPDVKFGDLIQWEPKGVLQFQEPKRVRQLSADGKFVFVDGQNSGLPIGEITLANPPAPGGGIKPRVPPRTNRGGSSANMRQDVFSIAEGDVVISWPTPLSKDSIADLKDWLKIVERKISRPAPLAEKSEEETEQQ